MFAKKSFPILILFSSMSTLVCCALPALFVTLGLGATFASLVSTIPQLVYLSEHKTILFLVSGALLAFGGYWQWRVSNEPCPIDPVLGRQCLRARRFGLGIYIFSLLTYLLGFFFSYLITLL